jgi:hypothetical protein
MEDERFMTIETKEELRRFLFNENSGLYTACKQKRWIDAAFKVRRYTSSVACYPGSGMKLDHSDLDTIPLLQAMLEYQGGLWCGGTSKLLRGLLQAVGIPAFSYGYGHSPTSHATNIFGAKDEDGKYKFYILDAYGNYHYEDSVTGELIPFDDLLRRIRDKQHDSIQVVEVRIPRPYVVKPGDDPAFRKWLFEDGIPSPVKYQNAWVYPGATYAISKLLKDGTPFRKRVDEMRGERTVHEFMLDLIFVNPNISRLSTDDDGYAEWSLLHDLFTSMVENFVNGGTK